MIQSHNPKANIYLKKIILKGLRPVELLKASKSSLKRFKGKKRSGNKKTIDKALAK